jgi:hypothetical protein
VAKAKQLGIYFPITHNKQRYQADPLFIIAAHVVHPQCLFFLYKASLYHGGSDLDVFLVAKVLSLKNITGLLWVYVFTVDYNCCKFFWK